MLKGLDERIASIYAPVQAQLDQVEDRLRGLPRTDAPYLEPLLNYLVASGGKRIRPAVTLLAADFFPHDHADAVTMASAVELLHMATLIHDDTVDNSDLRRGQATVGNLWGKHAAVLFGDYVFANSATFVCETGNVRVIRRFSETIMELASGELIEYFSAFDAKQARKQYDERIYRKTASLFRTAAEAGAILGEAAEHQIQALSAYGYNIGMAFQIVDDVLDVRGDPAELGKPVGNDLLQGVLTLPTIMLMERYPNNNPIEKLFKERGGDGPLKDALDMINGSNIINDCFAVVRQYCEIASGALESLPGGPARRSLLELSDYIRERGY